MIAETDLVVLLKLVSNHGFFVRITLKCNGWNRKTTWHLFYATSNFVQYSTAIGEFNLEFKSENAVQNRHFCPVWPWNLADNLEKTKGHHFYVTSSFVYHFIAIGEFKLELQSRDAQFWSKLYWLPWKPIGHLSYAASSFVHHLIAICEFKLELWSGYG